MRSQRAQVWTDSVETTKLHIRLGQCQKVASHPDPCHQTRALGGQSASHKAFRDGGIALKCEGEQIDNLGSQSTLPKYN